MKMSDEINLLPCPFCGGKAAITLGVRRDAVKTVDVICQDCSGAMLAFCEDDAIADWNTRVEALRAVVGIPKEEKTNGNI